MIYRTALSRVARTTNVHRGHLSRLLSTRASTVLNALDLTPSSNGTISGVYDGQWGGSGDVLESICPATGEVLAQVQGASPQELQIALEKSQEAFEFFRAVPAPKRGDILRQIREALAAKRDELGAIVSLEMGKIRTEGVGEVQEFIDIADYGVGLSRMMNGRVVSSERPGHSILEVPSPLGVVGVLSAFNFPVAVYGWNLALSLAAGNATLWKPSPTTPLTSIATTKIIASVLEKNSIPGAVAGLVIGDQDVGEAVVQSELVDMVSFTGSERVGRQIGKTVQSRFGKVLLELGGNNAVIVLPDADLSLAVPSTFFGAVGTAGQRCTSTRRIYLHRSIAHEFLHRLTALYKTLTPGDPLEPRTLLGPLHTKNSMDIFSYALDSLNSVGSEILVGGSPYLGSHLPTHLREGNFVRPTLAVPPAEVPLSHGIWQTETFAPVTTVKIFDELDEAIEWNNGVKQGLSSSLWTRDVRSVGKWLGLGGAKGSDCGIVNVNVGTSGAEIGAAFGGNKNTGWGRESGGDAWKQYVRWSAATINFSDEAPLAQGVSFDTSSATS
ncbi:NAD-aldehyde dehydrogenase [Irpex rosettiformis]|uniref:NAD-aldehyde dehydrogenase n=1 Tax=Irpex rosettiformis TaxID=378272 RepID=A0ACB8U3U9_9APHY|nr:NAD-aldehyde dehydrogenase [Irpex rosettiformis]